MVSGIPHVLNKCMPISLLPSFPPLFLLLKSSCISGVSSSGVDFALVDTHLQFYMDREKGKSHEKLYGIEQWVQQGAKCQM